MTVVVCRRCRLAVATTNRADSMVCPRCLAHSGNALSIQMEEVAADAKRWRALGLARLAGLVRGDRREAEDS
jgi:hypothetical protein